MKDRATARYSPRTLENYRYNYGGNRFKVLRRDKWRCVQCTMTQAAHYRKYKRSLDVDHIDGNGYNKPVAQQNHALSNLQTLCTSCHGRKDNLRLKNYQALNGRSGHPGETNGNAKLTWKLVNEMRRRYGRTPWGDCGKIAQKYGFCRSVIYDVLRGERWKSLAYTPPGRRG